MIHIFNLANIIPHVPFLMTIGNDLLGNLSGALVLCKKNKQDFTLSLCYSFSTLDLDLYSREMPLRAVRVSDS